MVGALQQDVRLWRHCGDRTANRSLTVWRAAYAAVGTMTANAIAPTNSSKRLSTLPPYGTLEHDAVAL